MRENPEDSHLIESYEKSNGYTTAKKTLLGSSPDKVLEEIKASNIRGRGGAGFPTGCLLYTSPSPRDLSTSRMPSSA